MTWPFENDTSAMVKKLANRSLQSARMKTVFSLMAIALSVGLLTGIVLSELGFQTAQQRSFQTREHVLYKGLTEQQAEKIAADMRVSDSLIYKRGSYTLEVDDYLLALGYLEQDTREMETIQIVEGAYPTGLYEAAADKAYLNKLGLTAELGQQITVDWLDGTEETFTVTGLTENPNMDSIGLYALYVSKEYARNGSQLKDVTWNVSVRLSGADNMSATAFRQEIRTLGADYGLDVTQVNEVSSYVSSKTLSQNDMILFLTMGLGVLFVSVLVIYNIFYISVVSRIRQFGQMRALGATVKQIRRMVRREGTLLCLIGAPVGLGLGGLVAFCVRPDGWSWWNALIVAVVVLVTDYITVQLSIRKSAKLASAVSPIDALRANAELGSPRRGESRRLHRKLTPMRLAQMGFSRNKKAAIITVLSLGVSGILFMTGFTLMDSASLEGYSRQGTMAFGEVKVYFSSNAAQQSQGGYTGLKLSNPMDDAFERQLLEIEGVKSVKRFSALDVQFHYHGVNAQESVRLLNRSEWERIMEYAEGEKLSYDDAVFQNKLIFMDDGVDEELFGWRFQAGNSIELSWYNGSGTGEDTFFLGAAIDQKIYRDESAYDLVTQTGFFLMPEDLGTALMRRDFNFTDTVVVKTDYETLGDLPAQQVAALIDTYPTLRYATLAERMRQAQSTFQTLYLTVLELCLFVIGFSLMNLVNTMLTSILARKRELVMLRSVSMSGRQFSAAIRDEGLIYSCWNIIIATLLGVPAGWLLVYLLKQSGAFHFRWRFPIWYLLGYALLTSVLPLVIARYASRSVQGSTLAEQLRTTE